MLLVVRKMEWIFDDLIHCVVVFSSIIILTKKRSLVIEPKAKAKKFGKSKSKEKRV